MPAMKGELGFANINLVPSSCVALLFLRVKDRGGNNIDDKEVTQLSVLFPWPIYCSR